MYEVDRSRLSQTSLVTPVIAVQLKQGNVELADHQPGKLSMQ